jgi:hypothetical protein
MRILPYPPERPEKNARLSPVLTLVVRFRCGRCEDAAVTNRYYVCASPSTPRGDPGFITPTADHA